jgi:ribonuclease BN (tRNA processing enzyme)
VGLRAGHPRACNYLAAKVPLNQINDIFITHLHWDHSRLTKYMRDTLHRFMRTCE